MMTMVNRIEFNPDDDDTCEHDENIQLRITALSMAIDANKTLTYNADEIACMPKHIVNMAEAFLNFLNGNKNENIQTNRN